MPFGKHKGLAIGDLPDDYLDWLLTAENLPPMLCEAVRREWDSRTAPRQAVPGNTAFIRLEHDDALLMKHVLAAGYKAVARVLHPDLGGDTTAMQRLNALADSVRKQLDEFVKER
jgi:hypothetical protein